MQVTQDNGTQNRKLRCGVARRPLVDWDRSADLPQITVPTLVIGATHDTMNPAHMRWMAGQLPNGQYLHCPDGSHLAQFDDPSHYFPGLISFLTAL
jgi:proline iminopeptidase